MERAVVATAPAAAGIAPESAHQVARRWSVAAAPDRRRFAAGEARRACERLVPAGVRWLCRPLRLSLVGRFTALSVGVTVLIAAAAAWAMGLQVERYVLSEAAHQAGVAFPSSAAGRAALLTPALVAHIVEMQHFILTSVLGGFAVLYAALFLLVRGAAAQLGRQNEALRAMVDRDALTGILNHRALLRRLEQELARATRTKQPVAVVLLDLDRFKLLNDTHGHPVGDRALLLLAGVLERQARALYMVDAVGRYGGDEFMAILPGADARGAQRFAARVLTAVTDAHFSAAADGSLMENRPSGAPSDAVPRATHGHAPPAAGGADEEVPCDGEAIPLSVSAGVAVYPYDSALPLELVALADRALYDAKHVGGGLAVVVNQALRDSLAQKDTTFGVLDGLVTAVDAKDRYTRAHSEHVAALAVALGGRIGVSAGAQDALRTAGLLHDVGKIGIPDRILRKPGGLTDEERRIIQQHVTLSEMIIQGVPRLDEVLAAVMHHHERWDGGGYPRGLAGERIPLLGRIMAVADAFSAMTLDRPYRKGMDPEAALGELARAAGTQLDPALVPAFVAAVRESGAAGPTSAGGEGGAIPVALALPRHSTDDRSPAPAAAA